jgi:hypothetical protein
MELPIFFRKRKISEDSIPYYYFLGLFLELFQNFSFY